MMRRGRETIRPTPRKRRQKSFKTEEAANKWAEKKGLSEYRLKNLKSPEAKSKKILIIKG
jgi:hypothetical protein